LVGTDTYPYIGSVFARFFTSGVLREIGHTGHSSTAGRLSRQYGLFEKFGTMLVADFYDTIFRRLVSLYRHEYIYKNALAQKILLGRHNLNTAFMLTELHVDDCKADVVVLNGTSQVYEIKSEMDNLERLDRQITAYRKMFDYITVVTTERLFDAIARRVPEEIGIMVLSEKGYQFKKKPYRRATSNKSRVDPSVILNSLQKREYLKIIEEECGVSLRYLPNTRVYSAARVHFREISPERAHDAMVKALKSRRDTYRVSDFVTSVPGSLKAASLSIRLSREEQNRFLDSLHHRITAIFK